MDIVFKFGEHYYEAGPDNTVFDFVLTILGSLLGFATALYFDRMARRNDAKKEIERQKGDKDKEDEKNINELRDRLIYIQSLVDEVVNTLDKQNEKRTEFINAIEKEPYEFQFLKILASNDTKRILNLDSQSTFYAYRFFFKDNADWVKKYKKFNSSVDFIDGHLEEMQRVFKSYLDGIYKLQSEYKQIVDNLPNFICGVMMKFENDVPNYKDDIRYKFLSQSVKNYRALADNSAKIKAFDDQFLEPLLLGILGNFEKESFSEPILDMAKKARVKLNDIKVDAVGICDEFKTLPDRLKNSIETLKRFSEEIQNNVR